MSKGKIFLFLLLFVLVLAVVYLLLTNTLEAAPVAPASPKPFRVVFYNTENLFDTINDPSVNDNDFTPEGKKKWTGYRYYRKLHHTFQALSAMATPEPPALIGMCEVENRQVLDHLRYRTPLESWEYSLVHQESPDPRGIDVALLYRPERFRLVSSTFFRVKFPASPTARTRDILVAKGLADGSDTLIVLVSHWSSRIGDPGSGTRKRLFIARTLRAICDSISGVSSGTGIILMGDFNDEPADSSVQWLTATTNSGARLVNLTDSAAGGVPGTYKYKAQWNRLDHIIVSHNLLQAAKAGLLLKGGMRIGDFDFLLEPDKKYLDLKPAKTFNGMKYLGGYSDHLPVYIDLQISHP